MADYPPAVSSGGKAFGAIRDNRGVVLGDASGHAHVIGTQNNYNYYSDEKLPKIRRWLSPPDPFTNYQKALKLRQAGTGGWFIESREYTRWKIEAPSCLWLYGIPGCGKTILCSAALRDVLRYCQDGSGRVAAYFFFDFNDVEKQDTGKMLRSLIWQLSQQSDQIPASLNDLFSSCESGQRQPSVDALQQVLRLIIQELPQAYIVLDALDECAQRTELMETLQTIAEWRLQSLHLLVTSRRVRDIESTLEEFVDDQSRICLQGALVDKDIHRYVQGRLATDKTLQKWRKDDVRQEIETVLRDGANGMFRWAVCQLDSLAKCRNRATLRKALATLPPTLDKTYERILSAISEADSEYAIRILQWLAFSARPLSLNEIAEVVAIDTRRDPAFDRDEVLEDPFEALHICSSLVTITVNNKRKRYSGELKDASNEIVALAHYSVKEYLVSDEIWTGKAAKYGMRDSVCHDAMARSCLGYLLQFKQSELHPGFLQAFRLARYSAEYWISHARKTDEQTEEIGQLAIRLFSKDSFSYVNWIRLWNPERPWMPPDFRKRQEEIRDPLYYTALQDLRGVLKLLLNAGADVNAQGGTFGTALQAASHEGHAQVVKLLLDAGADVNASPKVNAQGEIHGNALQAASEGGHEAIVKLLLNVGANVNAQGGFYGNALYAALERGYAQVVKLLLKAGVNINAQGVLYSNALQAASEGGHEAIVKLLLNVGADVNAQGGFYGNALQVASYRGHAQVVKLLLNAGADVNAQGAGFGNALQAASYRGHAQLVKLLLNVGADVNVQGEGFGNALKAASEGGHAQVVKLLLKAGADVNVQGGIYGNTLQAASEGGHVQVVRLLLNAGADVNAQDRDHNTALQVALEGGHTQVVKLLLNAGADA